MNIFKKIYYNKYSKQSYSLSNVDLIVDRLFKNKEKGIYIDVGCNHPIKYNNTYLLHKRGWVGINVDLDKESIIEFNKFRKSDFNYQAVVSSSNKLFELPSSSVRTCCLSILSFILTAFHAGIPLGAKLCFLGAIRNSFLL